MKLKTKIEHNFIIDENSMEELNFNFDLLEKKKKKKIVEVKRPNIKKDASTRLF